MKVALAKYYQENSPELYCTTCTSTSLTSTSTWMATSCTQPTNLNLSISFWFSLVHLTQIQCLLCQSIFSDILSKSFFCKTHCRLDCFDGETNQASVVWMCNNNLRQSPQTQEPRQLSALGVTLATFAIGGKTRFPWQVEMSQEIIMPLLLPNVL